MRGLGSRAVAGGAFVGLLVLLGPASAWGTTRYAAPGGTAPDTVCVTPVAAPCSINEAAAGPEVRAGDEAVIAPGDYSDTAGDLGGQGAVTIFAVDVHGAPGQPRPLITLNENAPNGGFVLTGPGARLAHVEVDSAAAQSNLAVFDGVVEDVVARSSFTDGIACRQSDGVIRDTACFAGGNSEVAVGIGTNGGSFTPILRNVTAIAAGTSGTALSYAYDPGTAGTLDAKSVIAEGAGTDVQAQAFGAGASSTLNLDHSAYDTVSATGSNGGTATVTPPGTGTNLTAPPLLDADGFHELPSSPTIDSGITDGSSGTADIDGEARTMGALPDIGADEFNPPPPTSGGPVAGSPDDTPPDGSLGKQPRKRSGSRIARFTFTSTEAGSQFRCRLDRTPYVPCSSPFSKRVKPGEHRFSVQAVDAAGNADSSPATYRWRVLAG
jgi:hypothetical protein